MTRRHLFQTALALIAAHPLAQAAAAAAQPPARGKMPVLFIGHGSPMNALRDTPFTRHLAQLGRELPRPRAILVVSAHWAADQPMLSSTAKPETIYDFGGFPQALYQVRYPSPGQPALAQQLARSLPNAAVDTQRGLDHGAWTVLHHLYPKADIPVIQLAMPSRIRMDEHVALATGLRALRSEGVLVLASGNIVHNLRAVQRDAAPNQTYDWSQEFDMRVTGLLQQGQLSALSDFRQWGTIATQAHPTYEHYLPLLYAAGAVQPKETPRFFNTSFQAASISMRSVVWG